jgi:hypothetical protein
MRDTTDAAEAIANDGLKDAAAGNWPKAIEQIKTAIERCGACSVMPLLHKDLGLVYCRAGNLKDGKRELLEAGKLLPGDRDIAKALEILQSK